MLLGRIEEQEDQREESDHESSEAGLRLNGCMVWGMLNCGVALKTRGSKA